MIWFLTSEMCMRVKDFPCFGSKNPLNDKVDGKNSLNDKEEDGAI